MHSMGRLAFALGGDEDVNLRMRVYQDLWRRGGLPNGTMEFFKLRW